MSQQEIKVHEATSLAALARDWNALAERSPSPSVFLTYEWFDAAWQWRAGEASLRLIYVTRGARIIGICPLVLTERSWRHVRQRILEFLTVPDTQLCEVLADPRDLPTVVEAVVGYLVDIGRQWDTLRLDRLQADSPALGLLRSALADVRLSPRVKEWGSNPSVSLADTWDSYYSRRSRRLKKGNNLIRNKILREHTKADIRWLRGDGISPEMATDARETVVRLSARSWKQGTGVTLDQPGPGAFIKRLTEYARLRGWLSIWVLSLDNTPAATEFQLIYGGRVHALRADYDPAMDKLSPGTFLSWRLLQDLFVSGLSRYEMGPGENPYKMRWAEETPILFELEVFNKTLRGWLLSFLHFRIRPLLRHLKRGLAPQQRGG